MSDAFDVIVIGAGMAGLTAARTLAQRNLRVCVVEASERVGGRVWSQRVDGATVELGAEFVHGRASELWALIEEAGLQTVEREGEMLQELPGGGLGVEEDEDRFGPLETLTDYTGDDLAFTDWLRTTQLDAAEKAELTAFVEGFNAADATKIGIKGLGAQQKAEDESEGMRAWHVVGGYQLLAEYLAVELKQLRVELRLGCAVSAVRWSEGDVRVETTQGIIAANRCIVTLPLSLVQQINRESGVKIEPEPRAIAHARRMEMGHATRFTLVFREPWWLSSHTAKDAEQLQQMNFLMTPQRMPPVWWVGDHSQGTLPTLTGWIGGPRADALQGKTIEQLGELACVELAATFGIAEEAIRASLLSVHTHDWSADRFSQGAYSYVPVGSIDASAQMVHPEADTLYFAGEHTDLTANWGTVHAAIRSGLRAASQVLAESPLDRQAGR